jgi:hypothetical protein
MKATKTVTALIFGITLFAGIACGGTGSSNSLPDLIVVNMQDASNQDCYSSSYQCGTDVIVKNIGAGNAGPFVVGFSGGIQQNVSAGLAAGQQTTIWFADYVCASGIRMAIVDTAAQVPESNESNNALDYQFHEGTPPPSCTPTPTPTPQPTPAH